MSRFNNEDEAYRFLYSLFHSVGMCRNIKRVNKDRHFIVWTYDVELPVFYCVYHRDFFLTFGSQFYEFSSKFEDFSKLGESINLECLEVAVSLNAMLLFIYPDGVIYEIPAILFKRFAEKYNLIRGQERSNLYKKADFSGDVKCVHEITCSVPINLMRKFEILELKHYR